MARNCDLNNIEPYQHGEAAMPNETNRTRRQHHNMRRDGMVNLHGFESEEQFFAFVKRYTQGSFMSNAAEVAAKSANRITEAGSLLAKYAPRLLGPDSPINRVRLWMVDAKNVGENLLDSAEFWARDAGDVTARFAFSRTVGQAYERFLMNVKPFNLTRDQMDRLWLDAMELGQAERLLKFDGSNRWTVRRQQKLRGEFINRARGYGLNDTELNALIRDAGEVVKVYDTVRGVARAANTPVDDIAGIGYVARNFTDDFQFRAHRGRMEHIGLRTKLRSNRVQFHTDMHKSRTTYEWIVEDELAVADAVGLHNRDATNALRSRVQKAQADLDAYRTKVNKRPAGRADSVHERMVETLRGKENALQDAKDALVDEMEDAFAQLAIHMNDDRVLSYDFLNHRLSNEDLDRLVDNGVIGKMPMTSTRVFDVLTQRYQLPYAEVAEMIKTDPVASFDLYKRNLSHSLGMSQLINEMHVNAPQFGFGVMAEEFSTNSSKYPGYKPINALIEKYGIDIESDGARRVYLQPEVWEQLDAVMKFSVEPAAQNAFLRFWDDMTSWWKTSILATPRYLFLNTAEVVLQSWRGGTNMMHVGHAARYLRDYIRYGPDALPDVKRFGRNQEYSIRDIFENAVQTGRLQHKVPMADVASDDLGRMRHSLHRANNPEAALDPKNLPRFVNYMKATLAHHGAMDGLGYAAGAANRAQRSLFTKLTGPVAFAQDAAAIANIMSTLDHSLMGNVGQFFSTGTRPKFDDILGAMRHADEYHYRFGNEGRLDQYMKRIIPFWGYMSTSMPAQWRHMIRQPGQFMAYTRLYAAVNGDARKDEEFTQAATSSWFGDTMPIVLRDPLNRDHMWMTLDLGRIDPMADMLVRLQQLSESTARNLGYDHVGRFDEQIDAVRGETEDDLFSWLLDNSHPAIQSVLAFSEQEHPFFGSEFKNRDEFMGVELVGEGRFSGGFQKYLVQTWVPQLNMVDDKLRELGFTDQTYINAYGEEAQRPELARTYLRALQVIGAPIDIVDGYRNLQFSSTDMYYVSNELEQEIRSLRSQAEKETSDDKRAELIREMAKLEALQLQVEGVMEDIDGYLEDRDVPTSLERSQGMRRYDDEVDELMEQYDHL